MTRRTRILAASALAASLVAVPASLAAPSAAGAHDAENGCAVESATLAWGVKESFRAYIGSAIAKGSWEVSNGAEYETPSFRWSAAEGSVDPATGEGQVAFTGTIVFTGHEGVLHLELANPVVHFDGDSATLLLDVLSNDPDGAVAVDEQAVEFASVPLSVIGAIEPGGTQSWPSVAPVVLTETGAAAFGGFYAAGDELDPISLELALGAECGAAEPTPTAAPTPGPTDAVTAEPAEPEQGVNGGVIAGVAVGVAALGAAAAAVIAVARRRRG